MPTAGRALLNCLPVRYFLPILAAVSIFNHQRGSMQKLLSLLALGLALSVNLAHAATDGDGKTKQQSKMTACNADAKGKKSDERKAFMKECLRK